VARLPGRCKMCHQENCTGRNCNCPCHIKKKTKKSLREEVLKEIEQVLKRIYDEPSVVPIDRKKKK